MKKANNHRHQAKNGTCPDCKDTGTYLVPTLQPGGQPEKRYCVCAEGVRQNSDELQHYFSGLLKCFRAGTMNPNTYRRQHGIKSIL